MITEFRCGQRRNRRRNCGWLLLKWDGQTMTYTKRGEVSAWTDTLVPGNHTVMLTCSKHGKLRELNLDDYLGEKVVVVTKA